MRRIQLHREIRQYVRFSPALRTDMDRYKPIGSAGQYFTNNLNTSGSIGHDSQCLLQIKLSAVILYRTCGAEPELQVPQRLVGFRTAAEHFGIDQRFRFLVFPLRCELLRRSQMAQCFIIGCIARKARPQRILI
ncbi:hypothetical protein D3C73_1230500 [compost metagenome]